MFTGIVQCEALIESLIQSDSGLSITVRVDDAYGNNLALGASIALNGACLTVVHFEQEESGEHLIAFDAIPETLKLTNLSDLSVSSKVNFERAAKFGDEIGGHLLSGHIVSTAQVEKIHSDNGEYSVLLAVPTQWSKYVFHKGYIGLNGCSLTIGEVVDNCFWVHLIPETLKVTNFSDLTTGDRVNLEIDSQTQVTVDTVEAVLAEKNLG